MSSDAGGLRKWARYGLVRAQKNEPLRRLARQISGPAVRRMGKRLVELPGVLAVFARHSHPGSPEFVIGQSDLDLAIVVDEAAAGDPDRIGAVADALDRLRRVHFYLAPDDARFLTLSEMQSVERLHATRFEILHRTEDWTLLAGPDVRPASAPAFPRWDVWRHPEFNQLWRSRLQSEIFAPRRGVEGRNLRALVRLTRRQLQHCVAAVNGVTDAGAFTERDFDSLLEEITRRRYWVDDPGPLRERVLLGLLAGMSRFFETFRPERVFRLVPGASRSDRERYQPAWSALRARLDALPGLTGRLAGAIAYPLPFCGDGIFQLDLMLPDETSEEGFSEFMREYRETLGRRLFRAGDYRFSSTILTAGLCGNPLVQHGSALPFLREHIQRCGEFLLGANPEMFVGNTSHEDLVAWCRSFVPFYSLTLGRRIEHSSRHLNFTQLASVRLFLSSGEVETDATIVRRRHRELFEGASPDERVWDYLQRNRPGRADRDTYRSAFVSFSRELDSVERLLGVDVTQPSSPS